MLFIYINLSGIAILWLLSVRVMFSIMVSTLLAITTVLITGTVMLLLLYMHNNWKMHEVLYSQKFLLDKIFIQPNYPCITEIFSRINKYRLHTKVV